MRPSLEETNPVGKTYTDSIQLGAKTVPLPEGEWKVIATGKLKEPFFKIILLNEHKDKQGNLTVITVDTPPLRRPYGYTVNKNLNREDMLHVVENSNYDGKPQDGWCINHLMPHLNPQDKHPVVNKASKYIRDHNLVLPNVVIGVTHHLTGYRIKRRYLSVLYYYNPELEGFPQEEKSNWEYCEWHKNRIVQHPERVAFIETLKKKHAQLHEKIKKGFGDVSPFSN